MTFRMLLWQLGFDVKNCPYCKEKLQEHFGENGYRYTCLTEGCRFNK